MLKRIFIYLLLSSIFFVSSCDSKAVDFADESKKQSYALGFDIGRTINQQKIDVIVDALLVGFQDGLKDEGQLTKEEIAEVLANFQKQMMEKQSKMMAELSSKNLKEGSDFLVSNKEKPGVVELKSGLQYKVMKSGNGKSPKRDDTVKVNYKGTLIDGTEFDSSYKRNTPASFKVNQVIPGWTEALQLMKEGDKWEVYIPAKLAYGERGAGPGSPIGPNSTLIFEVELLSIQ